MPSCVTLKKVFNSCSTVGVCFIKETFLFCVETVSHRALPDIVLATRDCVLVLFEEYMFVDMNLLFSCEN